MGPCLQRLPVSLLLKALDPGRRGHTCTPTTADRQATVSYGEHVTSLAQLVQLETNKCKITEILRCNAALLVQTMFMNWVWMARCYSPLTDS